MGGQNGDCLPQRKEPPMSTLSGMESMSPDALLAYCRYQLGGLDQEMQNGIKAQNSQLEERQAVEKVQSALESYGTQGPKSGDDMANCVSAFQDAIHSLPDGDPVRTQLQQQCDAMTSKYQYEPGDYSQTITFQGIQTPNFQGIHIPIATPPRMGHTPQDGEWKGTCEALSTLAGDIKDGAEIQMLQLQDLVSQQQQAVELFTGMMSKTDQTLEDQSKAIGR
jgi:hypothetical protein